MGAGKFLQMNFYKFIPREFNRKEETPEPPAWDWWCCGSPEIPCWATGGSGSLLGSALLREFPGEMDGDKTEEDFGAVNHFPSSIFSQGRLGIPVSVEEEGDAGMLPGRACPRRGGTGSLQPPPAHLPPPRRRGAGLEGEVCSELRPKWVLGGCQRGCTGSSHREFANRGIK